MSELDVNAYTRQLKARVAELEQKLASVEAATGQSERVERNAEAQAHLAAIVQSADAAILTLSPDFRIATWNRGAEILFGYTGDEAIGQRPVDFLYPAAEKERALTQFVTDVESFRGPVRKARYFEETLQRKDGTLFEASLIASGIYDDEGQLAGVSAIVRNISEQKRKERDLTRLASIVESSDDAISSIDRDFRITSWNPGAERMFGLSAREAIGQPITLPTPPELREVVKRDMEEDLLLMQKRRDFVRRLAISLPKKDGTVAEVSLVVSGIYDEGGNLVGLSQIFRDITETKRAEREQALLAALVKSSDDGIVSVGLDARILSWNAAAEKLFGFTAKEAIGQNLVELLVPPELREHAKSGVQREFASAVVGHPLVVRHPEVPALRKDGSRVEVSVSVSGIYDSAAKLLGASGIIHDITERKRAEREQALLAAIVTSTDDAVVGLSTDLRITTWNRGAEAVLGFSPEEAMGQTITLYVPPHLHSVSEEQVRDALVAAREHRRLERLETQLQRKDKTILDASVVASGIYDPNGTLIGLSGIIRDVTQQKRVERELATLASIVNASSDAIIGFSKELKITSWNPGAEATYGFGAEEAIGRGFDLFVPPEELPRAIEADKRLFATGQAVTWEQRVRRKDGTWFVSLVNIFPIRDADGNIVAGAGIGRDVTKLKEIEQELREAHEYTRGLIESSIDAMVIVDGEMHIVDGNEQLARLTEIPKKVLFGSPFESIFVDPQAARQAIQKTFADGFVTNVGLLVRAASGKEIPISFNASLFYRAGKVFGIFGVARDVTEQRAIERTLREEREYSRSLVQSSPDALLVCATPTCC
jgi:PAS domain S-box-containing protein